MCLEERETVIANNGDSDLKCINNSDVNGVCKEYHAIMLAHDETLSKRLKRFLVLRQYFRIPLGQHWIFFHAVGYSVQLAIETDEPLFEI